MYVQLSGEERDYTQFVVRSDVGKVTVTYGTQIVVMFDVCKSIEVRDLIRGQLP